jgi:hypothetical protein
MSSSLRSHAHHSLLLQSLFFINQHLRSPLLKQCHKIHGPRTAAKHSVMERAALVSFYLAHWCLVVCDGIKAGSTMTGQDCSCKNSIQRHQVNDSFCMSYSLYMCLNSELLYTFICKLNTNWISYRRLMLLICTVNNMCSVVRVLIMPSYCRL